MCDCLLQVLFGHCSAALRNLDTSRKPHRPLLRDIVSVAQIVSSVLMPGWTVRLGTVPGASVLSLLYFPVPPQRLFLELASARNLLKLWPSWDRNRILPCIPRCAYFLLIIFSVFQEALLPLISFLSGLGKDSKYEIPIALSTQGRVMSRWLLRFPVFTIFLSCAGENAPLRLDNTSRL